MGGSPQRFQESPQDQDYAALRLIEGELHDVRRQVSRATYECR